MSNPPLDPAAHKQQQREYWAKAAAGWRLNDERMRKGTAPMTERMIALAGIAPGMRVLDLASGNGEPGLPIAHVVGASGYVLLSDQSSEQLDFAREKAEAQGLANVEFRVADAEEIEVDDGAFDVVTCRCGLMFLPEPIRAMRVAHAALRPGGRVVVAVWGPPQLNPFYTLAYTVLMKYCDAKPPDVGQCPGIFAFAERSRLAALLSEAGFRDIALEDLELWPTDYESGEAYWQAAQLSGPVSREIGKLAAEAKEQLRRELIDAVTGGNPSGPVRIKGYALLAAGTK
ncbi:MAG TPA: methyltransferase domain-containing protein [Dehalococcoidia bacterium]|nr:methyltransferase domain-containing protein [Dehalococcoidia bacterium]